MFQGFVAQNWEIEFLVSEIVVSSPRKIIGKKKSLKIFKDRNRAINLIRGIQDVIPKNKSEQTVSIDLNRISHQQAPWNIFSKSDLLFRYYKIFSYGELDSIIKKKFNLNTKSLYKIGSVLSGFYYSHFALRKPIQNNIEFLDDESIKIFLANFSGQFDQVKNEIIKSRVYDEKLLYQFNLIRKYPIIESDNYICPITMNLYRQFTSGVYYSILNESSFSNYYGDAFKNYLQLVISKVNIRDELNVFDEEKYGKPEKSTSDIIVTDSNSILLIECKTKKMNWASKSNLTDSKSLESDLSKLAEAIYQLYKTTIEYSNNKYPQLDYNPSKKIYLLVVTLEDWYIGYNPFLYDKLRKNVEINLLNNNMDVELINKYPYSVFSSEEFERAIQVIEEIGINEYFDKFINDKGHDSFSEFNYKSLFDTEVKELMFS